MKAIQPLIISLLAHLWLLTVLYLMPSVELGKQADRVEVTYLPADEMPTTFVTDPENELKQELEKLDQQVKRLSRVTRRVREEQVAPQNGPSRNAPPKFSAREQLQKEVLQDSNAPSIERRFDTGVAKDLALGTSTIAEYVPEVRNGGFTSLNTDQFLHYTFYARINEQIRNRWISAIRQFVDNTGRMDLQNLARKTQITQVEILLDPQGHFVKAILHRGADREELDEAVLTAFRLATPFLNPPEEIVQEDGYIHLHYGFYVEFRPRYLAGSK